MAGVKQRSGGHNRRSVAQHLLNGTFRRDRHARSAGVRLVQPWQPSDEERNALSPRAQRQLEATLRAYMLDELLGARLLSALRSESRVERLEQAIDAAGLVNKLGLPHKAMPALARELRLSALLWAVVGFPRCDVEPARAPQPADPFAEFDCRLEVQNG